jgi:hypothetical protein
MTPEPQNELLTDSSKACLSLFYFACAIILPIIGFLIGWQGWDIKTGGFVALATFGVFILFSGLFIAIVQSPSWVMVATPLIIGILYAAFPDPVLGPFDDVAMNLGGAVVTFMLWIKKQPNLPRWIILPLLATGVYAAAGYFIPGPLDEAIVALVAVTIAGIGAASASPSEENVDIADGDSGPVIIDYSPENSTDSDIDPRDVPHDSDPAAIETTASSPQEELILITPPSDKEILPQDEDPSHMTPGGDENDNGADSDRDDMVESHL